MKPDTILDLVRNEAKARGLPTFLDLGKAGSAVLKNRGTRHDGGETIILLRAEGWAKYSRNWMRAMGFHGVHKSLAILGGIGPEGPWAVRVPGTITDVDTALRWLKPKVVRDAESRKLRVLRQGDVWIVERNRVHADDLRQLPSSHSWNAESRTLTHNTHSHLHVPFFFKAIPQRTIAANGVGRRQGD